MANTTRACPTGDSAGICAAGAGPMKSPKARGVLPTDTVVITVLLVASMTETLLVLWIDPGTRRVHRHAERSTPPSTVPTIYAKNGDAKESDGS